MLSGLMANCCAVLLMVHLADTDKALDLGLKRYGAIAGFDGSP